eukprot:CAMPEP_0173108812 /NCGR_PEP_ID=MMETSP1102-20130122/42975_1 /TAXON_ID=49646 /ORGANISM="Geminigera sp., Strain Caron Lab Isolate" /LENGTH=76 /DNA_ID=CAMNT_0014007423 /DNA_START=49 /DNA_END=276 /DNA_ORIENTATION=+
MFELADGAAREVQLNAALRELDDEKHVVLVALAQRDAALASSHAATRGGARREHTLTRELEVKTAKLAKAGASEGD